MLEWHGGHEVDKGDVLVKFNSYSFHDIFDLSADQQSRIWVEDSSLSKESALEKLTDNSHRAGNVRTRLVFSKTLLNRFIASWRRFPVIGGAGIRTRLPLFCGWSRTPSGGALSRST